MSAWQDYKRTMVAPTTLWDAAKADDVGEIARLLDAGAELNARDARGYSALMLATYAGNSAAFELLIARGADPNSRDAAGNTVLMGAAFKGHLELARKLIAAGAELQAKNTAGVDAAGFAAMFGRSEISALFDALRSAS